MIRSAIAVTLVAVSSFAATAAHAGVSWSVSVGTPYLGTVVSNRPVVRVPVAVQPVYGPPVHGQPAYESPVHGQPAYESPGYELPAYASPAYASPAYASPAYASPAYASPAYASAGYAPPAYGQRVYVRPVPTAAPVLWAPVPANVVSPLPARFVPAPAYRVFAEPNFIVVPARHWHRPVWREERRGYTALPYVGRRW